MNFLVYFSRPYHGDGCDCKVAGFFQTVQEGLAWIKFSYYEEYHQDYHVRPAYAGEFPLGEMETKFFSMIPQNWFSGVAMLKKDVIIGRYYTARINQVNTIVHLTGENSHGGYHATNLKSGREIFLKSAGKLRGLISPNVLEEIVRIYCPDHPIARLGKKSAVRTMEQVAETPPKTSECESIVGVVDCGRDYISRTFGEF